MGHIVMTPAIEAAVDRLAFALATRGTPPPAPAHNRQPVTHMAAPAIMGSPAPAPARNAAPAAPVAAGGTFTLPREDGTANAAARPCAFGFTLPFETDATAPARAGRDTFQLPSEA